MIMIREGTKKEVVALSNQIPEMDNPHNLEVYDQRMEGKYHLILVAETDGVPVGFKVGYDKSGDRSFYTWLGAVLPKYRRQGIARQLAERQEQILKAAGYQSVQMKTRNAHQHRLIFAISSGFKITKVTLSEDHMDQNSILLSKTL